MKKKNKYKQSSPTKKGPPLPLKTARPPMWKNYSLLPVILIISFLVYLPVLQNGLLAWDDDNYIKNNPLVHTISLKEIFSTYVMGNYHPLTILTFAIEYQLFGLNETAFHAVNLFLHLLNVVLVFYAMLHVSGKTVVAVMASLLFGIHPLHVESVAWAAELKDLLYTFFFLAAYIFYLKFLNDRRKKFYFFSLLLFLCSLLSKAMAASLPVVLLLTDYFTGKKINGKTLLEKLPFFLLSVVFGVVAIWAQQSEGATEAVDYPLFQRLVFASYGFISYLFKLVLPLNLSAYYPYPVKSDESLPVIYYLYPAILVGLIIAVYYSAKHTRKIFFGLGFFAITVFLVLQFLPVGGAIMADRYSYVPSIGIFYLAGEAFHFLINKKPRWQAMAVAGVFAVFFSVKTFERCKVWQNDLTLWNDVISRYQTIPYAYNNRGRFYLNEGKNELALADFNKALELKPDHFKAYNNRGILFMNTSRNEEALADFNKAIELMPGSEGLYMNRGNVLKNLNRPEEAMKDLNKTIEMNPGFAEAWYSRGNLYMSQGKTEEAISDFSKAIELNKNYVEAILNRANVLRDNNRYDEALRDYEEAIRLNPGFPIAYFNRGTLYMNRKLTDMAIRDYEKATQLNPTYFKAWLNMGNVFSNTKKYDDAIRSYSKAIEAKPDYAEAYYGRSLAAFYSGKKDNACADMKKATSLGYQPAVNAASQVCN